MVKREILGGRIGKFSLMIMLCFTIIFTSVGALIGTSEVANAAFGFGKGEGIAGNPYIISTPEELNAIRFYPTAHYMLGNDIDLTEFLAEGGAGYNGGSFWDPIYLFTGKLDGNGYIVSGLKINRTGNYIGFFSQPASGAEIKNIGFENVDVFGNGLFIGGLAGALVNPSTAIMNSYTTGKVSGISYVGGLVGYQRDSSIMNSYSLAEVGGASSIGGLVGYQDWGSISNSYAAGLITNSMEGGLVGASNQGTYDHSFYDKKSIAMDNGKGIAKTTTEMQTKSTFEAEGWDFFGVWYMSANEYPQLRIFVIAETPAANPPGGSIVNGSTVTISSGTAGAAIYYTTNGDEPTTSSTLYESSSPVIIDDDLTIKAIAMYTGKIDSEVMSNSYSIIRGEAPVTGSLEKGTVSGTTTLKGVTAAMEYKVNSGEYVKIDNTAVTDISINAGDKIYVRLAATELALASYAQVLTAGLVDIKPASAPTSASLAQGTNSGSAKLSGVTNVMEYSLDGEDYTSITTGNTIDNMAVNAGDSIYVRIAATVQQPASDVQVLQVGLAVIKPATAPTTASLAPGTSSGTTKLSGVTDTMEYSLDGEEYTLITTGASVDNISVNAEDSIYVRIVATVQQPASEAQELTVALANIKAASAPTAVSLAPGTSSGTTKLSGVTDTMEYSLDGEDYTLITTGASVDNISVNAEDSIYVRIVATVQQPASEAQELTVALADIKAASAPTTASLAPGTSSGTTKLSGVTDTMEYSLDGEDYTLITTGASVDNISVNAGDSIYVRIAATMQQPASDVQVLTVVLSDIKSTPTTPTIPTPSETKVTSSNGQLTIPKGSAGEVSLEDSAIVVFIPSDAASNELKLTIERVSDTKTLLPNNEILVSSVFELLKNISDDFKKPVTLTFTFDSKNVNSNQRVAVFYFDEVKKTWVEIAGGKINGNRITVEVNHFTKFAVLLVDQTSNDVDFNDISGYWAEDSIKQAVSKGIVKGYTDGSFKPRNSVTRAEFTVMLMNALKPQTSGIELTFTDTTKIGAWAQGAVAQAVQAGIINGYSDGTFRPNAEMTRAEMAAMISKAMGLSVETNAVTDFADDKDIPSWAKSAVAAIKKIGLIEGKGTNKFDPNAITTRAEAVTLLLKMLAQQSN